MFVRVDLFLWLMVYPRLHVAIEGVTTYAETCSVETPSCLDESVYNLLVIANTLLLSLVLYSLGLIILLLHFFAPYKT